MVYNCDVCGMDLKRDGKTKKTYLQSYKVLIVTKEERWKCSTGCELKGINNKLNALLKEESEVTN